MQLIRGLHNISRFRGRLAEGCVLTIGNFDGIHLGHLQVLQYLAQKAQKLQLPSVVMVFEPLPIEYFAPKQAPVRLMNLREKLQAFEQTQIDFVLCVRFDEAFASLSAAEFVERVLVKGMAVKHLVIGDDFRFGQGRRGDFTFLQQQGAELGFAVTEMPTFYLEGARVSSTRIRQQLALPNLDEVAKLLGTPFAFSGRVIHGQKLGRTLGFPTLNLNPKRLQMPVQGVFAVQVAGLKTQPVLGVANIGLRPTVAGLQPSIEVHLFDWSQDVYGRHVSVRLCHFIRAEQRFANLAALQSQIRLDVAQAREFFVEHDTTLP
ncbi:MAG: bifunctional riboflavin kinase/FAD synthetase [Thiotrichales bacterium]|nr:bifunctional riboflavin kinase/FAD synthetase [Thiotrichales bacterium]